MKAELIAAIPLIDTNNCLTETNDLSILILDDPNSCCVIHNSLSHFTITNNQSKNVLIFAIDKCCLDNTFVGKRCDFGFIVENGAFYLTEIKDTRKRTSSTKAKAIKQLENTIIHFDSLALFNNASSRTAIISWKYVPSRPATQSSMNTAKIKFFDLYKFDLFEGNEISV